MSKSFEIGSRTVGGKHAMYLIAEVGLAHDGSLGAAYAFVDAAIDCGVDAIKFQTHIPAEESSKYEQFRVKVFPQDETRRAYWARTAFNLQQWIDLASYCRQKGIDFLSSPFSNKAVDWLQECDVAAWKIASGEVTNLPMLERMIDTGKPLLVSSGMSSWQELDWLTGCLNERSTEFGLFQCTTAYPCPPESWGLNVIPEMAEKYQCPIGFSDHSGTIFPGLAARMMGASFLEFHIVFHKSQFGPDTKASLTLEQTKALVQGVRSIETSLLSPVDKDQVASSLEETRQLFAKSIYARIDLQAGDTLTLETIDFRKPEIGIPTKHYRDFIGKKLQKPVGQGEPITRDCFA